MNQPQAQPTQTSIRPEEFRSNLLAFMGETFEDKHQGIYLDKGTSLFETLETVSAKEASIPVGGKCASLAAQVAHVIFYIESFERFALQGPDHIRYEATLDDPQTYTRPWTIEMPLYRLVDRNAQLLEHKCVPFADRLLYQDLLKDSK